MRAVILAASVSLCQNPRTIDLHIHRPFDIVLQHHDPFSAVLVSLVDGFPGPVIPEDKPLLLEHRHSEGVSGLRPAKNNLLEIASVQVGRGEEILLGVNKVDPVGPHVHGEAIRPAKKSPAECYVML